MEPVENEVAAIVLCHTRELAFQVRLQSHLLLLNASSLCPECWPAPRWLCWSLLMSWGGAPQICHEFERFGVYMKVKVANFFGGFPIKQHKDMLKTDCPHIIVGTPGRLKQVWSSAATAAPGVVPRCCGCTR